MEATRTAEATAKAEGRRAEGYDVEAVRADFPALRQNVYEDQPLVYLDNAATTQKPQVVIDRLESYYTRENSNIHRGVHYLSQQATDRYEEARQAIAESIGTANAYQCIFTRGTTEAINLVASTFGEETLSEGDQVVLSAMEHHSNIVPWQRLCEKTGARLEVVPITDQGELIYDAYLERLTGRTRLVAVGHVSNTLGTINPVEQMIGDAHEREIPVLIDGAQAVPHLEVDVQALGCDFYCFSGHKMYGPTGVGILYGREDLLEEMPPYQGGGDMIDEVAFEKTTYAELPHKFEAGTPGISSGIALGAAVAYLDDLGRENIRRHEQELLAYATERVKEIDSLRVIGTAPEKAGALSFLVGDIHPYDAGTILDRLGIAVRTGHHCTQPLMERLGIPGTVRASLACYNNRADIDRLVEGLYKVKEMLA